MFYFTYLLWINVYRFSSKIYGDYWIHTWVYEEQPWIEFK